MLQTQQIITLFLPRSCPLHVPTTRLGNEPLSLGTLSLATLLQSLHDTIIGRVLAKVIEPEKSSALAGEDGRDPAEGVIKVPDGDADASVDLDAGADDLFFGHSLASFP